MSRIVMREKPMILVTGSVTAREIPSMKPAD